jgi:large subunit ribosomal protein L17
MRHGKKINHLGRTAAHRNAMLSNMASSLIISKRVTTTVAKAKALRQFVEPLLTKAKDDTTHSRRTVFATLQNKESLKELYGEVAAKIATRPGGYTRTLLEAKNAAEAKSTTTRRSRRRGGKGGETAGNETNTSATEVKAEAPAATTQSAPADTATDTLTNGETREEATAE